MIKLSDYNTGDEKEFLEDFLLAAGITFETNKKIDSLKNYGQYNTASFYLPKYKLYIEYCGSNDETITQAYKKKKAIYEQHKIPSIFYIPKI